MHQKLHCAVKVRSHLSKRIGVSETKSNGIEGDFQICDKRFTRQSLSKLSPAKVTRGDAPRKYTARGVHKSSGLQVNVVLLHWGKLGCRQLEMQGDSAIM
jgi:hypothetical protein